MIEIKKWIKPDIEIVLPNPSAYADTKFLKYNVLFEQQILVIHECQEDGGTVNQYRFANKYYGLRVVNDKIEVCIPKFGWIPIYEEIQDKYNNEIADKTILGD